MWMAQVGFNLLRFELPKPLLWAGLFRVSPARSLLAARHWKYMQMFCPAPLQAVKGLPSSSLACLQRFTHTILQEISCVMFIWCFTPARGPTILV